MKTKIYQGIECTCVWNDDPIEPWSRNTAYISFGEWDEETNLDSFGVDDDYIFYYFDRQEVADLWHALITVQDSFSVCDEWYIDFTDDWHLVEVMHETE